MKKIVLLTGATGAIGKATAFELAKENCQLILLGRNADKLATLKAEITTATGNNADKLATLKAEITTATGNNDIDVVVADLSEGQAIKKAAEEIRGRYSAIHAIVNIAAIFTSKRRENSVGQEYMFATNHLSAFILTNEMLDLLKSGTPSRVVTVSAPSVTKINFDDVQGKKKFSAGFTGAFGASKMMNIMFTYALARRLEGTGVTTSVYHPGLVKSELTSEMPAFLNFIFKRISSSPDKAAKMLCRLAIGSEYANSNGTFFKFDGKEIKSNAYSYDTTLQEKLWTLSEQLAH